MVLDSCSALAAIANIGFFNRDLQITQSEPQLFNSLTVRKTPLIFAVGLVHNISMKKDKDGQAI